VPADVARARYEAVLAERDRALRASQAALVGRDMEILVDEQHADSRTAIGRAAMDAPEVDLVCRVRGSPAAVGELIRVHVEAIDREMNLVGREVRER
jgi:ribosomal protein S12 methylthiotransferase